MRSVGGNRKAIASLHRAATIRLATAAGETKSRDMIVCTRRFYRDIYRTPHDVFLNRDDFTSHDHNNLTIPVIYVKSHEYDLSLLLLYYFIIILILSKV